MAQAQVGFAPDAAQDNNIGSAPAGTSLMSEEMELKYGASPRVSRSRLWFQVPPSLWFSSTRPTDKRRFPRPPQNFRTLYSSRKSQVYRAIDKSSGETVVVKVYKKKELRPHEVRQASAFSLSLCRFGQRTPSACRFGFRTSLSGMGPHTPYPERGWSGHPRLQFGHVDAWELRTAHSDSYVRRSLGRHPSSFPPRFPGSTRADPLFANRPPILNQGPWDLRVPQGVLPHPGVCQQRRCNTFPPTSPGHKRLSCISPAPICRTEHSPSGLAPVR